MYFRILPITGRRGCPYVAVSASLRLNISEEELDSRLEIVQ